MTPLVRLLAAPALAVTLGCALTGAGLAETGTAILKTARAGDTLSEKKQTKAGLYITAAETAEALTTREDVILLEVRSPEETMFVGYTMTANPGFIEATKT